MSKLKDYPQFRAVEIAIRRSGFKVCMSSHSTVSVFVLDIEACCLLWAYCVYLI